MKEKNMKITVKQLLDAQKNLANLRRLKDVPAKTAFGIIMLLKTLETPSLAAMKTQTELIKKYKGEIKKNDRIEVSPDKEESFRKEWTAFLEGIVDINLEKVKFPKDFRLPNSDIFLDIDIFIEIE
jgi:hypothetical protein